MARKIAAVFSCVDQRMAICAIAMRFIGGT
jgi:hypothetical protein